MSIRDKISENSRIANLEHSISGKSDRTNPMGNRIAPSAGYSGNQTYRQMPDGAVMHGMKFGSDWYYRKYTTSGEDNWDISELIGVEYISSTVFSQNLYSGRGWGIWKNDKDDYTLEIDNLLVRRTMTIWELEINQLRASNGTFIVGSSAKVAEKEKLSSINPVRRISSNVYHITFESVSDNYTAQPFKTGDVIASKRFWHKDADKSSGVGDDAYSTIDLVVGTVTNTSFSQADKHVTIQLTLDDASVGVPESGMSFVRVASSVPSRRGLVLLSSDGNDIGDDADMLNVPFVDVYGDLQTYDDFLSALGGDKNFVKVRMGRLDHLTGKTDDYGVWTNNLYLQPTPKEDPSASVEADYFGTTMPVSPTGWFFDGYKWYDTDDKILYRYSIWNTPQTSGTLTIGDWYNIADFNIGDDFTNVGAKADYEDGDMMVVGLDYIITDNSGGFDATGCGSADNVVGTVFTCSKRSGDGLRWVYFTTPIWGAGKVRNHTLHIFQATGTTPTNWTNSSELTTSGFVAESTFSDAEGKLLFDNSAPIGGAGFYAGGSYQGYYDGGQWATYIDSSGDFFLKGAGAGDSLTWNHATNTLTITGSINLTNTIDASDISDVEPFDGTSSTISDVDAYATGDDLQTFNEMMEGVPDTPSGTGLFATSTWLGFYDGGAWKGWWRNEGTNAGDFYLSGTDGGFYWDYSASSLYLGGFQAGDTYIKTVAGAGNIEWYGYYGGDNVNYMTAGANINGTGWWGISLEQRAFIYKYNTSNNAVSTIHSELYNQTTNYIGGISTLVSTTTDAGTPAFTTINVVTGTKSQAYVTGAYTGAGVIGVGQGNSSGDVYGGYFYASNSGSGNWWAIYARGHIHVTQGIWFDAQRNVLFFDKDNGSTGSYVYTYSAGSEPFTWIPVVFKGDTAHGGVGARWLFTGGVDIDIMWGNPTFVQGASFSDDLDMNANDIVDVGNVDGVDVSVLNTHSLDMAGHGFSAYLNESDLTWNPTETRTMIWAQDWEDSYGESDCFGTTLFTCRHAGRYYLKASVTLNAIVTGGNSVKLSLITSAGNREVWIDPDVYTGTSGYITIQIDGVFDLAIGNTAYVQLATTTTTLSVLNGQSKSTFEGFILGVNS